MFETFLNRDDAGNKLADRLSFYVNNNPLILMIPRGGVVVAYETIRRFGFDWDLIIPRKIGTPFNKEVAIGAVAPDGTFFVDERRTQMLEIQQPYIEREAALQVEEIKRRIKKYKGSEELPHIKERTVILVDDGIATGYTILAAIKSIRKQGAEKLVLAVPVAPEDTLEVLGELVDEIICLLIPKNFRAVGLYYEDFDQVTDDEVQTIIKELSSPPLS